VTTGKGILLIREVRNSLGEIWGILREILSFQRSEGGELTQKPNFPNYLKKNNKKCIWVLFLHL